MSVGANMLDVNKLLSQQIVRSYINDTEALGDLPTDLNKALHRGSLSSMTTKLNFCACMVLFLL